MEPFIKALHIKRFRSIPAETVHLSNPLFLVGKNGSGKTNFVDVFGFLAEAMVSPLQAVFDRRGGIGAVRNRSPGGGYPPNLGIRVDLGRIDDAVAEGHYAFEVRALPDYGFEVVREQCRVVLANGAPFWFDRDKKARAFATNLLGVVPKVDRQSLALPIVGGVEEMAPVVQAISGMKGFAIEPSKIRELQDPDTGTGLKWDGSNLASVLQQLQRTSREGVDRICELLATIVPGTKRVRPIKHGKKLSLEFVQEWAPGKTIKFEAFAMSDGTLRALGLLVALNQEPSPSLIAIEEPEATIHPGALGAILDVIRAGSRKAQIVITTHSPELLDAKWISDDLLRVVSWERGATRITPLGEAARDTLRDHLMGAGELLRSNALESEPLFDGEPLGQRTMFEDVAQGA